MARISQKDIDDCLERYERIITAIGYFSELNNVCAELEKIRRLKRIMYMKGITAEMLGATDEEIDDLPRQIYRAAAGFWLGVARKSDPCGHVGLLVKYMDAAGETPESIGITEQPILEAIKQNKG